METRTWAYKISEVEGAAYSIIDDACFYLARADKQCKTHPSSCRTTMLSLENFKKAVSKAFDVVFLLQRLCDVGSQPASKQAIEKCRRGENWRIGDYANKKHKLLDDLFAAFPTGFDRVVANALLDRHQTWSSPVSEVWTDASTTEALQ